jgi:hypothetical protein
MSETPEFTPASEPAEMQATTQPESRVERVATPNEAQIEMRFEPVEMPNETQIEMRFESVDPLLEVKAETPAETPVDFQCDLQHQLQPETRTETPSATRPERDEAKVETKVESQVEIQLETRPERRTEARLETWVDTRAQTPVDTPNETFKQTQTETSKEIQVELQGETWVDTQADKQAEKQADKQVEKPTETLAATRPERQPAVTVNDRPFRVKLRGSVLVLIKLPNKRQMRAALHQLSTTGGVINLEKPLDEKIEVELIFHIDRSTIHGKAQMLFPMWATQGWMQPFRFVEMADTDRNALQENLQTFIGSLAKGASAAS